jgi:hypothetical protein
MMILYIAIVLLATVPALPILYLKMVVNAFYVSFTNNREDYKGQNVFSLFVALFFGPFICIASIVVDLISMPSMLLRGSKGFEHKYVQRDVLNQQQTQTVLMVFDRIFKG